ncbi:MAG: hypothetical protein UZ11_BCD004002079 [Bacteroidetes bacterium OLB11]|nr:MAG: hypothetical protein UZ11_BCD004002079 [Bacteroidetes bacterium OLB11]
MKSIYLLIVGILFSVGVNAQVLYKLSEKPDPAKKVIKADVSCGECNFGLDGSDCDLAVKIGGKAYYVDGVGIKDYGHPHDENGFCIAIRKAELQGDIVDGRFKRLILIY